MTPDNMEQKAMDWYLRRMNMENEPPDIIEAAKTIDHVKANVEMLAAFARSIAPLPLSMTEEEIDRIGREQYPPDTTNDGDPWHNTYAALPLTFLSHSRHKIHASVSAIPVYCDSSCLCLPSVALLAYHFRGMI